MSDLNMNAKQLEYEELFEEYNILFNEFNKVKNENIELLKQLSENTVISSMEEMKEMYNKKEEEISKLKDFISDNNRSNRTVINLINTIISNLDNYHTNNNKPSSCIITSYTLENRLEFIKENIEFNKKYFF